MTDRPCAAAVDERVALMRRVAGEERFAQLKIEALVQQVIVTGDRRRGADQPPVATGLRRDP